MLCITELKIYLFWLARARLIIGLRRWWYIRVPLSLLCHEDGCKCATLHLFLFLHGACFPLSGFLAGPSALQVFLNTI